MDKYTIKLQVSFVIIRRYYSIVWSRASNQMGVHACTDDYLVKQTV